jgi:hypothetical protein
MTECQGIESYSHEQLLAWVNEANSDPCPRVLIVSIPKRGMRHGSIHLSAHAARCRAMEFQSFDPDLVNFESIRAATPEEIARDAIKGKLLFEESL